MLALINYVGGDIREEGADGAEEEKGGHAEAAADRGATILFFFLSVEHGSTRQVVFWDERCGLASRNGMRAAAGCHGTVRVKVLLNG